MRRTISKIRALFAWLRAHPKKVIIPSTIIILGLVSFGGYKSYQYYDYMNHNPKFCRACHVMEEAWDRWQTSEHSDVNCHECHSISPIGGARLLLEFSFGHPERVGRHAIVQDNVCDKCHESGNPRWVQVAATAGHRVHAEEENIACIKCHSVTLHRFSPPKPICAVCHEEKHIEVAQMGEMHCLTCHDYLNQSHPLLPDREPCLGCHLAQGRTDITWPEDAPMQFDCRDCHQPHEQAKPIVDCLSCHVVNGLHQKGEHRASQCQTCHKPHGWQVSGREACLACHPGKAEHNLPIGCATCHSFQ